MFKIKTIARNACLPRKKTGYHELCASETTVIEPNSVTRIPTHITLSFPPNYFLYVSTLSVDFFNTWHVIDSDYRGEVFCSVKSNKAEKFTVKRGDPVARLIFFKIVLPELEVVHPETLTRKVC